MLCGESRDAEMTIILNEEPAATAEAPPPPVDRTLRPCDEDKVLWTAPSNEANIDEPENKGVSEVMFMSMKAILKGRRSVTIASASFVANTYNRNQ